MTPVPGIIKGIYISNAISNDYRKSPAFSTPAFTL
jgi:hypothetical protein